MTGMTLRHVLFDADGVLQHIPEGWYAAVEPYLGDRTREFLLETWSEELPMLVGDGDYLPVLAAGLERYGVTEPAEDVYRAVWFDALEVVEESFDLVRGLRASGSTVVTYLLFCALSRSSLYPTVAISGAVKMFAATVRSLIGTTASPSACDMATRPCMAATDASGSRPVQSPAA